MSTRFQAEVHYYLTYTITHLLDISNRKYLRRPFWAINPRYLTSMSLGIEYICFFSMRFVLVNLCYTQIIFIGYNNNGYCVIT